MFGHADPTWGKSPPMSKLDTQAWELLCEETKHDMHQFDYWEDIPERMKEYYRNRFPVGI